MSKAQLTASRALWRRRAIYRHAQWKKWHKTDDLVQRQKWWDLYDAAVEQIKKRNAQLEKLNKGKSITSVTSALVTAISEFEGGGSKDGRFYPYRDEVGVWTIGYGHTENVGPGSKPLTKAEALALLKYDLNVLYAPAVVKALKGYGYVVNQDQFNALVSFCYNLGAGYFVRGRSIGDALYFHSKSAVAKAILLYDKAGGRALPGLTRRRKWESKLYDGTGSYKTE